MNKALEQQLVELLGSDSVSTRDIERLQYTHDMAPVPKILAIFFKSMPDAVVRPKSAQQLQQLMKFATANAVPVTPRGRATTMMGGAYPVFGGISLDMSAHNGIVDLNESGKTVKVKSGTTWEAVLKFLAKRGLTLQAYPTSAPSATIGGWLGNSGGGLGKGGVGIGSSKFGYAADTVADLSVVLPTGTLVESVAASEYSVKDFIGSDGVLCIYDTATLKIRPLPARQEPFSFDFKDTVKMCAAIKETAALKPFFLLMEDEHMLGFKKKAGLHVPPVQNLVTVVMDGDGSAFEADLKKLRKIMTNYGGRELSHEIAEEEWHERYYAMRHKKIGPNLLGGEISVPVAKLPEVFTLVEKLAAKRNLTIGLHVTLGADGVLIMPQALSDERKLFRYLTMLSLVKDINDIGIKLGGIPYGVGLFNGIYAKDVHGAKYAELVRLKKKLDPKNVMNPGKALHFMTRFSIPIPKFAYGLAMLALGMFVKYGGQGATK